MRVDTPAPKRRDFFVYIDEFQSFTTLALANMLSELRKYRVGFAVAHQFLHQLTPEIRHAVLGNVGTFISFRVGPEALRMLHTLSVNSNQFLNRMTSQTWRTTAFF
jgi:hypothetical protein